MGMSWLPSLRLEGETPAVLSVFFVIYLSLGAVSGRAKTKNTNTGSELGSCSPKNRVKKQIDDCNLQKMKF